MNPFEPDNNFGIYLDRNEHDFNTEPPVLRVFLIWGLEEQDMDDCQWSDIDCEGDTRYDRNFNIESMENQQALLVRLQSYHSVISCVYIIQLH